MKQDPTDLAGGLAVELCEQFLKGACNQRALRYLERALDHLVKSYRNEATIRLADRALEVEWSKASSAPGFFAAFPCP